MRVITRYRLGSPEPAEAIYYERDETAVREFHAIARSVFDPRGVFFCFDEEGTGYLSAGDWRYWLGRWKVPGDPMGGLPTAEGGANEGGLSQIAPGLPA